MTGFDPRLVAEVEDAMLPPLRAPERDHETFVAAVDMALAMSAECFDPPFDREHAAALVDAILRAWLNPLRTQAWLQRRRTHGQS